MTAAFWITDSGCKMAMGEKAEKETKLRQQRQGEEDSSSACEKTLV